MRTYTFPMTPEQWAAADLSYYTLCRINVQVAVLLTAEQVARLSTLSTTGE